MPLIIPTLDDRKYQDLLDEALARIPMHNPEWLNFNKSDPGVTLIELFAFFTETLLFRSNQIPERNRLKFLQLLGIQLQPASSARGLVTFTNDRGPLQTITLNNGLEVRAGQVPFRTETGLDVLPIETQVYYKRKMDNPPDRLKDYYRQLYASFVGQASSSQAEPLLYETVPFSPRGTNAINLSQDAVDASLWIALLARPKENIEAAREAIAGKTISLGVVPELTSASRQLLPGGQANAASAPPLQYQIPIGGALPALPSARVPKYQSLFSSSAQDVLARPDVVQITLPTDPNTLKLWDSLDPLEAGVGDFPPALDDTTLNERLITWLRISLPTSARGSRPDQSSSVNAQLLWVGINTVFAIQRASVANELLPQGTGEPDQVVTLSRMPVIADSVQLTVTTINASEQWQRIDDLLSAGPEVPVPDLRKPPGAQPVNNPVVKVFTVNPESGEIRFGDGTHGARPPLGAILQVNYAYGVGIAGNVGTGTIDSSPALPAGIKVSNPLPTWGGADAETVLEAEKQIPRYLQHRDRLVSAADFETITLRTPGVNIGRVEVIPAFNPELGPNEPGDAPGVVTLMVIPSYDPNQPDAPVPDRFLLDTICDYLDSRRLVTTEVFLRGPFYRPIWVSVGMNVVAGVSVAQVREAVKQALLKFLSPLPPSQDDLLGTVVGLLTTPQFSSVQRGWPLRKPVVALELAAVASRVQGVLLINQVLIAEGNSDPAPQIGMSGLELPRVLGISVGIGNPLGIDQIRGQSTPQPTTATFVPVPVIPEECR